MFVELQLASARECPAGQTLGAVSGLRSAQDGAGFLHSQPLALPRALPTCTVQGLGADEKYPPVK